MPTPALHSIQRKRKRSYNIFIEGWVLPLVIDISDKDPENKKAVTIYCRFCSSLGRENTHTSKKQRRPLHTVKNTSVHERKTQRPFQRVHRFDDRDKRSYFDIANPFVETMKAPFGFCSQKISENISTPIVDNIVYNLLESRTHPSRSDRFHTYENGSIQTISTYQTEGPPTLM